MPGPGDPLSVGVWQARTPRRRWWVRTCAGAAMLVVAAVTGTTVAAGGAPLAEAGALGLHTATDAWAQLPDTLAEPPLPARNTLLAADGTVIAQVFAYNRIPVALNAINRSLVDAVVATEDRRFFDHHGIDPVGTLRAVLSTAGGDGTQGGSTITQQYVKNVQLAASDIAGNTDAAMAATGRTVDRKLREAKLAIGVENTHTKDQILTSYLNIVYFGNGAYGVGAAAHRYFSTTAAALTVDQSALLAGIINSPSAYDPFTHPDAAIRRRNLVIDRMRTAGKLSNEAAAKATRAPLGLSPSVVGSGCITARPQWGQYCEAVRTQILTDPLFGATAAERSRALLVGGMTVHTWLNPAITAAAADTAADAIPPEHRVAAAVAVVQPGTGAVAALASNRDYGSGPGQTEVPLATTPSFMPGSTFKLFTLASAVEAGIDVTTVLPAGGEYFSAVLDNPDGGFHNAEGHDDADVTIARATELSLNTAYVQLMEKLGVARVADMATRMGITSLPRSGTNAVGPREGTFTLGARDVSVLDMANAYATIAARGQQCRPTTIASVTYPDATTTPVKPRCTQVVNPAVADTVTAVLAGVVTSGTGTNAALADRPVAGKTGTAEGLAAAWFDGFTPQWATAVWVGDPANPRDGLYDVLGYPKVYGATIPSDIFRATMTAAHVGLAPQPLPGVNPAYLLGLPAPKAATVIVPDLTGVPPSVANRRLHDSQLAIGQAAVARAGGPGIPGGVVVHQTPAAGTTVALGSTVAYTVSP